MVLQGKKKKNFIILIAIVASIILYLAGVFSGLSANKLVREETQTGITSLKTETKQNLQALQSYVDLLDSSLRSIQLEQTFMDTLSNKEMCNFSQISQKELFNSLSYYWERLPFRMEEYERYNEPSEEYKILKEQYAQLSIRTWIIAKNQYEKCNRNIVHGLYFYSADCQDCIKQGEELDKLSIKVRNQDKDTVLFPIDFYLNETIVKNLEEYYKINSTPALIINDKVFQGRLFKAEELLPK
jgi:hypothetical protein